MGRRRWIAWAPAATTIGTARGRMRASSHSRTGAPRIAVAAPVGIHSRSPPAIRSTSWSVSHRSPAPIRGDQMSCCFSRRAPESRLSAGATSPTKPTTPTALTVKAESPTAAVSAAPRIQKSRSPRLRAPASSSPRRSRGRTRRATATTQGRRLRKRLKTTLQSFWLREPAPHR